MYTDMSLGSKLHRTWISGLYYNLYFQLILWQFWFDRLEVVLAQILQLCPDSPKALQLSNWMALTALSGPSCSAKAV
jgi:hypothetical protein